MSDMSGAAKSGLFKGKSRFLSLAITLIAAFLILSSGKINASVITTVKSSVLAPLSNPIFTPSQDGYNFGYGTSSTTTVPPTFDIGLFSGSGGLPPQSTTTVPTTTTTVPALPVTTTAPTTTTVPTTTIKIKLFVPPGGNDNSVIGNVPITISGTSGGSSTPPMVKSFTMWVLVGLLAIIALLTLLFTRKKKGKK